MAEATQTKKDFRDEYVEDRLQKRPVIDRRNGGCAVIVEERMFVWGGQTEIREPDGLRFACDLPLDEQPAFDVLNLRTRTWSRQLTYKADGTSRIPINGLGSALVYCPSRKEIYLFGGWNMEEGVFHDDLFTISTSSFQWRLIVPKLNIKPSPRYNAEMLLHEERLCLFAGLGPDTSRGKQDSGADNWRAAPHSADGTYGWNNEYFEFDLNEECWSTSAAMSKGDRPPPIAGHRMVKIDSRRALMFGGTSRGGISNKLWLLDLENRTWEDPVVPNGPWPKPARFFSLTPLVEPYLVGHSLNGGGPVLRQKLILLWGKAMNEANTSEDCNPETWLLEIGRDSADLTWTKLQVDQTPRAWHVAVPYHPNGSIECEVIVSNGNKHVWPGKKPRNVVSDTCILTFGVRSLERLCVAAICAFTVQELSILPPKLHKEVVALITSWKQDVLHAQVSF